MITNILLSIIMCILFCIMCELAAVISQIDAKNKESEE